MEGIAAMLMSLLAAAAAKGQSDAISKANAQAPQLFIGMEELVRTHGHRLQAHSVVTDDGYVLTVHRLLGHEGGPPVLMQHGFHSCSDVWVVAGPQVAPGYLLANSGYDVWLGNIRGNKYCRHHKTLSTKDPKFWTFSWHEMGIYDLPAVIDYILLKTNQSNLYYVGHSMGNNIFYVMASMKPEYNSKIRLVVSLAPAPYIHGGQSHLLKFIMRITKSLKNWFKDNQLYELLPNSPAVTAFLYHLCNNKTPTQVFCLAFMNSLTGNNTSALNKANLPLYFTSMLAGSSMDTWYHFQQIYYSGHFQRWDYGPENNMHHYGQSDPPKYDLQKITTPVALHYSEGDILVPVKGVKRLAQELPNVVQLRKVPKNDFSHIAFLLHEQVRPLLCENFLQTMATF